MLVFSGLVNTYEYEPIITSYVRGSLLLRRGLGNLLFEINKTFQVALQLHLIRHTITASLKIKNEYILVLG